VNRLGIAALGGSEAPHGPGSALRRPAAC
jgi:hypothetical protein